VGSSGADVAGRRWAREAWGVGLVVVGVESGVCVCVRLYGWCERRGCSSDEEGLMRVGD